MDYCKLAEAFLISQASNPPPFEPPKNITMGESGILSYLTFAHNNVLVGELVDRLGLSSGRVAIALKGLDKKGDIVRQQMSEDKRKYIVSVTDSGRQKAIDTRQHHVSELTKVFEYLGEKDTLEFIRLHERLINRRNNK